MIDHIPVLFEESIKFICEGLNEGIVLDCTCGAGGHAKGFLENTGEGILLKCIDRDKDALEIAKENLTVFNNRVEFLNMKFSEIGCLFDKYKSNNIKRVFYDLGISSMQIDKFQRGFTYKKNQKLDMRMGKSKITANEIVNKTNEEIETTEQLVKIIRGSVPVKMQLKTLSRIFQALRIAVNNELYEFEISLNVALERLESGAKVGVITYHSLERNIIRKSTAGKDNIKVKKVNASKKEIKDNRRGRSGKLYRIEIL
jgi:16S rRNA (cytosine1402-N4)-methyltransferase